MKSTVSVYLDALPLVRVRFADYVQLIRPRIALLVLFTVAVGFGRPATQARVGPKGSCTCRASCIPY